MKNNFHKSKYNIFISFVVFICFFNILISQSTAIKNISMNQSTANITTKEEQDASFGFIVPLASINDAFRIQINCRVRYMVNDLLREQISVYWAAENFTINVKKFYDGEISENDSEIFFERGSFIIPFTGNLTSDKKIVSIVYDYNNGSEIEQDDNIKLPMYLLINHLTIDAYQLSDVKIAEIVSPYIGIEPYFKRAEANGFSKIDLVWEKDLGKKLKNSDYNVVIWGQSTGIDLNILFHILSSGFKLDSTSKAIRNFVSKGGGFVGSCYGAYMASCAAFPSYLKKAYDPNLPSFIFLAISDIFVAFANIIQGVKLHIVNDTHPVTFGLDQIIINYQYQGPRITYVGKNSQAIAYYYKNNLILDDTPSWVSSTFGNGKVMIFSSHPEIYAYDSQEREVGDDIICNALYYTTYKNKTELLISQSRELSFIFKVWESTENLIIDLSKQEELFKEIKMKINESINEMLRVKYDIYFYFGFLSNCLKNTDKNLNLIEKTHYLFKNNSSYIKSLTIFKNDLSEKINEIKDITKKFVKTCLILLKLMSIIHNKPFEPFLRIKLLFYNYYLTKFYQQYREEYQFTPQINFNSLEFLKHYWYEYEANVKIF